MDIQQLLGKRIRMLREQRGLSQEELAYLSGTQTSHISRIELGQNNTTVDVVLRIARGLNIRPSDLLDFEQDEIDVPPCDTNILKVVATMKAVSEEDREHILRIVKTFLK